MGSGASARIIFSSQKHPATAEVTVSARQHTVVGLAEAPDLTIALRTALEKAEKQAIRRRKTRLRRSDRRSRSAPCYPQFLPNRKHSPRRAGAPGRLYRRRESRLESTLCRPPKPWLLRPMTIEEAVKEAESLDRQVFIFRDLAGDVKVLHCAGDGLVRLTEVS